MTNFEINYDLIGKHPEVENLGEELSEVIARFQRTYRDLPHVQMGLMSKCDIKEHFDTLMADPKTRAVACDAIAIELCAAHFWGIDPMQCTSTHDVISRIEAMEETNKFK